VPGRLLIDLGAYGQVTVAAWPEAGKPEIVGQIPLTWPLNERAGEEIAGTWRITCVRLSGCGRTGARGWLVNWRPGERHLASPGQSEALRVAERIPGDSCRRPVVRVYEECMEGVPEVYGGAGGSCAARILDWEGYLHCCRYGGRSGGWLAGCCSRSSTC
jgi:hypothetical protein